MKESIVNRVAQSPLVVIDLEDFYDNIPRFQVDMAEWLEEGLILREQPFREALKQKDWSIFQNTYVAIYCSTDAIIPAWASMLVASYLAPVALKVGYGNIEDLDSSIFQTIIETIDYAQYSGRPVIVKGCSNKPIPTTAFIQLIEKLRPIAKSVMFGEACSSVPLFKNNK